MQPAPAPVHVAWHGSMSAYDFGRGHPMSPVRLDLTMRLAAEFGLLTRPGVELVVPREAAEDELRRVHHDDYVQAVRRASAHPEEPDVRHGLGTEDVPCFAGMHEVSARIVGATTDLALAVWEGRARRGVNITGGMHHAMANAASGFCVYNDSAVAIARLLEAGAQRVAYVDLDVHHGDGVQAAFFNDPRVLTISLHESPLTLFPGTGRPAEIGGAGAEGSAVNVALPAGTGDAAWLRAFDAVVPPLLRSWQPEFMLTQHGCDSHVDDPLANLALTIDGQRAAGEAVHALAEELCDGRWVAVGGGGYAVVDVVPRSWTHLVAEVTGVPLAPTTEVPDGWRSYVSQRYGRLAPLRMTDGGATQFRAWEDGFDPADALDRAVSATRREVFPWHGLDVV